jgi:surfeit locus 1 family protein
MLRRLLVPGLSTLVMLALLIGLGTWQVQRLHWKLGLLAQIDHAEALPGVPLPPDPAPFTKVRIEGRLRNDLAALYGAQGHDLRAGPTMGGQLIVPLERPGQDPVLVDRGWIPATALGHISGPSGETTIDGYVRPAEHAGAFAAPDDPPHRLFYTLDPQAIGGALGLPHVAPFTLIAMGPTPASEYPDPAQALPRPPNNHLSYAITWYGLAVTLLVIFSLYARKAMRPQA